MYGSSSNDFEYSGFVRAETELHENTRNKLLFLRHYQFMYFPFLDHPGKTLPFQEAFY